MGSEMCIRDSNQPSEAKDVNEIDLLGKDLDYLDVPAFLRRQAD